MAINNDLLKWCEDGIKQNHSFMVVTMDDSTGWSYPEYLNTKDEVKELVGQLSGNPDYEILEIYNLTLPLLPQVKSEKAWSI